MDRLVDLPLKLEMIDRFPNGKLLPAPDVHEPARFLSFEAVVPTWVSRDRAASDLGVLANVRHRQEQLSHPGQSISGPLFSCIFISVRHRVGRRPPSPHSIVWWSELSLVIPSGLLSFSKPFILCPHSKSDAYSAVHSIIEAKQWLIGHFLILL